MRTFTATFTVTLPFQLRKEDGVYLSCCPPLDVWSQGMTAKEARENLVEAVGLFISSCFVRGTLDSVLRECGFVPLASPPKGTPKKITGRQIRVPVPVPFAFHGDQSACQS